MADKQEIYESIDIIKRANVYFEGKVNSRNIILKTGEKKTLGFMLAGKYKFNTQTKECMEILAGECYVTLKGENKKIHYGEGEKFYIPANNSFDIEIDNFMDYCCSYIQE